MVTIETRRPAASPPSSTESALQTKRCPLTILQGIKVLELVMSMVCICLHVFTYTSTFEVDLSSGNFKFQIFLINSTYGGMFLVSLVVLVADLAAEPLSRLLMLIIHSVGGILFLASGSIVLAGSIDRREVCPNSYPQVALAKSLTSLANGGLFFIGVLFTFRSILSSRQP